MSHVQTHGQRQSLAERRFQFWDAESRRRRLEDWESEEWERASREMRFQTYRDTVRAQAAPPPPRKRGKK
jgi:hypothetical protein